MKYTKAWLGNYQVAPLEKNDNRKKVVDGYWVVPCGAIHTTAQLYLMAIAMRVPLIFENDDGRLVVAIRPSPQYDHANQYADMAERGY